MTEFNGEEMDELCTYADLEGSELGEYVGVLGHGRLIWDERRI